MIKLITFETPSGLFPIAVSRLILLLFTLETPSGLFLIIVSGLAGILLFGVLFVLLKLSGEHGHLFFISLNVILYAVLPPIIVLTLEIWWSMWCTHLLGSLKCVSLKFKNLL